MLGKLLKYEFRATGRVFLPMYAVLLVMSLAARLFYAGQLDRAVTGGVSLRVAITLVTILMVMLFTAVWVVTLVLVVQRFHRNLLGREGYLMHVLPVESWEHVLAKLLVATVWVLLSMAASYLALRILLSGTLQKALDFDWENFHLGWRALWSEINSAGYTGRAVLSLVLIVLNLLLMVLRFVLSIYAAMCVGQLVNRRRTLSSVGAYFGISIISDILTTWLITDRYTRYEGMNSSQYGMYDGRISDGAAYTGAVVRGANTELLIFFAFSLAVCAILYFLCAWILKKKLNLQ